LSPQGSFFTIRKHLPPELRPTLETLVEWGMCTTQQADTMVELVIKKHRNCMVVGSTSSGKTTIANAILSKLPPHERVFCIEDSPELNITVENKNCLKTNPQNGLTARELVKLAMRQRPDRLILGETRGDESFDLVRAMNSGHDGTVSTIHASSAYMGLEALEMLYQMSLPIGASIPTEVAQKYIASAVQVLVFAARRYELLADGSQKSVRRIEEICFVKGVENGKYVLEKL
jgi:pilus assembly protein CpaF